MDTWLSFSCCLIGGQRFTMKSKNNQRTMGRFSFWIILKYTNVFRATFSILFSRFRLECRRVSLFGSDFAALPRGFFPPPLLSVFFLLIARVNVSFHVRQPCTNVHV